MKTFNRASLPEIINYNGKKYKINIEATHAHKEGKKQAGCIAVNVLSTNLKGKRDLRGNYYKPHTFIYMAIGHAEYTEYTLPAEWITALINNDFSGMEEEDETRLNNWLAKTNPGAAIMPEDPKPNFQHGHDENRNEGADVITTKFVKYFN